MNMHSVRQSIIEFHRLRNVDRIFTFYYDETNNFRKLRLTERGLNVERADSFVLGGILHEGASHSADYEALFHSVGLQKSSKELKFKHVASGDFEKVLGSRKLGIVFKWLLDNKFYIHYLNLNILLWSVVDIIDSIIEGTKENYYSMWHLNLKSDLYTVIKDDEQEFLRFLHFYEYPNIKDGNVHAFCQSLYSFVKFNSDALSDDRAYILKRFLEDALDIDDLYYIQGMQDRVLVEDLSVFYLKNIYIYKNSIHIFDAEEKVEKIIKSSNVSDADDTLENYSFINSKSNYGIQVSDVVCGFLGRYFTYLKDESYDKINEFKLKMNSDQKNNLALLKDLIDRSDAVSNGFFNKVACEEEIKKHVYFLHDA